MTEPTKNEAPELKEYNVILNGVPTTVQLTEEDYEKQGWKSAEAPGGYATKEPAAKSKLTTSSKSHTPPNKARTEESK